MDVALLVAVVALALNAALQLWQIYLARRQLNLARQQILLMAPQEPTSRQGERALAMRSRHEKALRDRVARRLLLLADSAAVTAVIDMAFNDWIGQGGADLRPSLAWWGNRVGWLESCVDERIAGQMDADFKDAKKRGLNVPEMHWDDFVSLTMTQAHQHVRLMPRKQREELSAQYLCAQETVGDILPGAVFE